MQFGRSKKRGEFGALRDRSSLGQQQVKRSRSRSREKNGHERSSQKTKSSSSTAKRSNSPDKQRCDPKKKDKEFAWMDSDDDGSGDESSAASPGGKEALPPSKASEIQTFSQMMRMASKLHKEAQDLSIQGLAAVCQAASRVKFYDAGIFEAVQSAIRRRLRGRGPFEPGDVVDIITGLADVNAYDRELFEASIRVLEKMPGQLPQPLRKRVLEACVKVDHGKDLPYLKLLSQLERSARYSAACNDVAAEWQKPGVIWKGQGCESGKKYGMVVPRRNEED
eukprot:gnl/MRDRNA2_/MRDRNA2_122946_c0_seq1.p1 gnl/MRDRNA2_/MRDRNA2_122946_c0~~gnl/MRDRNA2_/MRDRNA2_122946_c0_seq1.p1  ORF type:complete len:280 (+),score=63.26 gnl/MRDRNA2_/MRDRNA2_122946_c0_seq1:78-917(+)